MEGVGFVVGFVTAFIVLIVAGLTPKHVIEHYQQEAFKRGYMEKVINDKDQVIYQWVEPKK
jgi:hypothetical protein